LVWNRVHVDLSSGTRIAKRARFGNARASVRASRCNFIFGKEFFACNRAEAPAAEQGQGHLQNSE
jgi:hypothetical protein